MQSTQRSEELKMSQLRIPHDAVVFVGDGRKALFLRNTGDAKFPNLRVERTFVDDNPATHEQGSDKPGRAFSSVDARRSRVEQTDWHELEEKHFARDAAAHAGRAASRIPRRREAPHRRRDRQGPDPASGLRDREAPDAVKLSPNVD